MSMRDAYKNFKRNSYLYRFFQEKDIPDRMFDVEDSHGVGHMIPNEVVVEFMAQTSGGERKKIEDTLRKIDFANGDVNHFLEFLAKALAEQYSGVLRGSQQYRLTNRVARDIIHDGAEFNYQIIFDAQTTEDGEEVDENHWRDKVSGLKKLIDKLQALVYSWDILLLTRGGRTLLLDGKDKSGRKVIAINAHITKYGGYPFYGDEVDTLVRELRVKKSRT